LRDVRGRHASGGLSAGPDPPAASLGLVVLGDVDGDSTVLRSSMSVILGVSRMAMASPRLSQQAASASCDGGSKRPGAAIMEISSFASISLRPLVSGSLSLTWTT